MVVVLDFSNKKLTRRGSPNASKRVIRHEIHPGRNRPASCGRARPKFASYIDPLHQVRVKIGTPPFDRVRGSVPDSLSSVLASARNRAQSFSLRPEPGGLPRSRRSGPVPPADCRAPIAASDDPTIQTIPPDASPSCMTNESDHAIKHERFWRCPCPSTTSVGT